MKILDGKMDQKDENISMKDDTDYLEIISLTRSGLYKKLSKKGEIDFCERWRQGQEKH